MSRQILHSQSEAARGFLSDMLICAVSAARDWSIFTMDPDFKNYARVLAIQQHILRK